MNIFKNIIICGFLFLPCLNSLGQDSLKKVDIPISVAERNSIIRSVQESLAKYYVSSDVAALIVKTIEERNKKGIYARINKGSVLSDTLTRHLRELSKDEHLGLIFHLDVIPPEQDKQPTEEEKDRFKRFVSSQNYGFEKLERLPGNIGYMELNGFASAEWGAETAIAALNFLSNTDALIIDLRYNGGGVPGIIQLICSYFFEKPTHYNSVYWREGNRTEQFWTMPYVPGKKYLGKPIYILTSKNTFSAPEDFAYSLQVLKRAVIIGDKTKGGANAGQVFPINEHFQIYVPIGKAVNPVTGMNWEGGIIPNIEVKAADALKKAHNVALQNLIDNAVSPQKKQQLQSILQEIK